MNNVRKMSFALAFLVCGLLAAAACKSGAGDTDWTKRPLKTAQGTVDGIKFAIDLPDNIRQKDQGDEVDFDVLIDGRVYDPSISIRASTGTPSLEDWLKYSPEEKATRKEAVADGFIISGPNEYQENAFTVYVEKAAGDKKLICQGNIAKGGGTPDPAGSLAKLEQICLSLKPL
jgi:hypothetical protein